MSHICRFSLKNNPWQFGHVERQPFHADRINDIDRVAEWHRAQVPGNVRLDLLAVGHIPEPSNHHYPQHQHHQASQWVDAVDWWYRTELKVNLDPGQRAFVRFWGLDYLSAIFVNGQELTRHEGMFSRQLVELTPHLAGGCCQLAVRLWGAGALPKRQLTWRQRIWETVAQRLQGSWVGIYPNRTATLKTQMSFGWDFAPRILTTGIWDDVECIITGQHLIEDCQLAVQPSGEGLLQLMLNGSPPVPTDITLSIRPDNFEAEDHIFHLTASPKDYTKIESALKTKRKSQKTTVITFSFTLPEPKLWSPWDRGYPHLYKARVDVGGSDIIEQRFGIRSVRWRDWQLAINGQNTFVRGLNWAPADAFPGRITTENYAALLSMAKETGANLLRVWGGGLREKQAFYDRCDELGLLVWQEFPFACVFLGTFPREADYLHLVECETTDIVRQIRHHPSLALWCGGNEFSPRRNSPLIKTLTRVLAETRLAGDPPFTSTSPTNGDNHNWQVWHGGHSFAAYQAEEARMMSEFGLQALPDLATLTALIGETQTMTMPVLEQTWAAHQGDSAKLMRYLKPFLADTETGLTPANLSLSDLITASQRAQAAALQTGIEHMRRRKNLAGGVILWQFNEPWPAISWAILDYHRRPKLAYQYLKWWYNPVLVCLEFKPGLAWQGGQIFRAPIWGINDTLAAVEGNLQIALDSEIIFTLPNVSIPADAAQQLGILEYQFRRQPISLSLTLRQGDMIRAHNHYDLTWHDPFKPSLADRFRRWVAHIVLQ